ncbi:MAG: HD domain-containing protein [Chloroflexi bacterium]|nr:HD domain-containing protein [Chloroflexota bacterium]
MIIDSIKPTEPSLIRDSLAWVEQPSTLIRLPNRHNPLLQQVLDRVNADTELHALWHAQNVNAVERLGMNDHGPVHMQIVANIALRLLRLIVDRAITPDLVVNYATPYKLGDADAEVVVVLAALLHDLGMSIHRVAHEDYSLFIAIPVIDRVLDGLYPPGARAIMRSEILHAIISHRAQGKPLTIEAGVVRVADALDMTKGRSRIVFEQGNYNVHSVSAAAIEKVEITHGEAKAVRVRIVMNNSAGIYQVDELMKEKLRGSGIEQYLEVEAVTDGITDKKLVQLLRV